MGLDTVELVMAVEQEFGIEIPNEAAARMATVGQIHAYLIEHLGSSTAESGAKLWERLVDLIVREHAIKRKRIRSDARFGADLGLD